MVCTDLNLAGVCGGHGFCARAIAGAVTATTQYDAADAFCVCDSGWSGRADLYDREETDCLSHERALQVLWSVDAALAFAVCAFAITRLLVLYCQWRDGSAASAPPASPRASSSSSSSASSSGSSSPLRCSAFFRASPNNPAMLGLIFAAAMHGVSSAVRVGTGPIFTSTASSILFALATLPIIISWLPFTHSFVNLQLTLMRLKGEDIKRVMAVSTRMLWAVAFATPCVTVLMLIGAFADLSSSAQGAIAGALLVVAEALCIAVACVALYAATSVLKSLQESLATLTASPPTRVAVAAPTSTAAAPASPRNSMGGGSGEDPHITQRRAVIERLLRLRVLCTSLPPSLPRC
jgi:hypothetical protein